jgi:hypothetical protein
VSVAKTTVMAKPSIVVPMPRSGTTKEAKGVAHTKAVATTPTTRGKRKAIHQALRPNLWSPRGFQPSLEKPSRVTTSIMMSAVRAGVTI